MVISKLENHFLRYSRKKIEFYQGNLTNLLFASLQRETFTVTKLFKLLADMLEQ
jgi:hypothetical protein